jgi:surfactin synthase thioesterase subunit
MGWPQSLPPSLEVCPVLLPGRWTRMKEPPFTEIAPLVRSLGESIRPQLDKPFALFGHSTGALIAFELARWLRKHSGCQPAHLFVSGCGAPHIPGRCEPLHVLPEAEFVERLRSFEGIPEAALAEPELRGIILPILRADLQLTETYVYEHDLPLACPITACGGSHDPMVDHSSLEAWQEHTSGKFTLRLFPSGHMFLRTHGGQMLDIIRDDLLRISGSQLK